MRALSIRQPYAELILRGICGEQIKPFEFRSRPTKRIGERFYIYASQQWAEGKLFLEGCRSKSGVAIVGDNIEVPTEGPQPWMLELAKMLILKDLPTGVIVGTASIKEVVKGDSLYEWHLTDPWPPIPFLVAPPRESIFRAPITTGRQLRSLISETRCRS